jgi:isopenicillin-N epimerase
MSSRRNFIKKVAGSSAAFMVMSNPSFSKAFDAITKIPPDTSPEQLSQDELFWSQIQSAFDLDRTIVNFNNGGCSPSPDSVHRAFKRDLDYSNQGPSYYMWRDLEPNIEGVREQIARNFGCDKEEIAITRNASESLLIVQLGLDLKPGDEILTSIYDYPRMLTTWDQRARRDKIVVNKVKYPVPLMDPKEYIKIIEEAITPKTKAILTSHVVFLTGQILPIKEIAAIAHSKGIPFICDGAHSFSHFPFKLKDLDCDFFGTSLHKWTYAPIGTGFLYVNKDLIPKVWPMMAAPESMDNNIRKFEEIGTHPAANHNAIAEALAFNEGLGLERKAARLRYLHKRWINRLRKYANVKFMTNIDDENQWCGIVTVNVEGADIGKLSNYLMNEHKIFQIAITTDYFRGLRISPNVYTRLSEIDRFADAMTLVAEGKVKEVLAG